MVVYIEPKRDKEKDFSVMAYDDQNIFAKILRGEIPCSEVYRDEYALAFKDISPQAPVHILVIPTGAYVSIEDFGSTASTEEVAGFYKAVSKVAAEQGLSESGYRVIANTGLNGGQEVPHFHMHILGGAKIGPMVSKV
jgi:diadenosine tetraphosphate (Ap4A) HIT family hydrolase